MTSLLHSLVRAARAGVLFRSFRTGVLVVRWPMSNPGSWLLSWAFFSPLPLWRAILRPASVAEAESAGVHDPFSS